jgi:hypothetical protein
MQAREVDFKAQKVAQALSPTTSWAADRGPAGDSSPPVKTLQSEDPGVAARKAAYLGSGRNMKQLKREADLKKGTTTPVQFKSDGFLSQVQEVEADVQYRFTLRVLGAMSRQVVVSVCYSAAASNLPKTMLGEEQPEDRIEREDQFDHCPKGASSSRRPTSFRCLCAVSNPLVGKASGGKLKLAKLVFHPMSVEQDIPRCRSHQEALCCTMVFPLAIDQGNFEEQLAGLTSAVDRMRSRQSKKRLRPVRAVLLCKSSSTPRDAPAEEWASMLSDFEDRHGDLWMFGPVDTEDGNALYSVFSEIASVRLSQSLLGADGDDALDQVEDLALDKLEEDAEEDAEELDSPGAQSRTNSEVSEGWQRPPSFETEIEGSEVSETAVEYHERIFGAAA